LKLNISASRQNIKNLIGIFGAIHVGIMHANFQASSFTGVGGEWGDEHNRDVMPDTYTFGRDGSEYSNKFKRISM